LVISAIESCLPVLLCCLYFSLLYSREALILKLFKKRIQKYFKLKNFKGFQKIKYFIMGIFASRNGVVTEDVTDQSSNINPLMYRYPPKQGNYFSNYFIMGGERFDVQQPEAYLFGDNSDLNFLGNRPVPVCYLFHFYIFILRYIQH
jgi:hypothetical protein